MGHQLQATKLYFLYSKLINSTANTYPCADLLLKCLGMRRDTFPRMTIDCESLTALHAPLSISSNITQFDSVNIQ